MILFTKDIIDELSELRSEIAATRQEIRILAELLGIGDQFDQALLKHQTQLESENGQRQQRRQEFLDSVPDTKIDCPSPRIPSKSVPDNAADGLTSPDLLTPLPLPIFRHPDPIPEKIEKFHI